jgi:hypothetical protein
MRFATVMDDSNAFFKEQKRVLALARRLQEENECVFACRACAVLTP